MQREGGEAPLSSDCFRGRGRWAGHTHVRRAGEQGTLLWIWQEREIVFRVRGIVLLTEFEWEFDRNIRFEHS